MKEFLQISLCIS